MNFSLVVSIAKRFVFDRSQGLTRSSSNKKRGFISFIAGISIAGLALGVTALLVVTSVMNGFERELKKSLTAFHGHVLMFSRGEPISNYDALMKEIKSSSPSIKAVSPYVFSEVMLSSSRAVAGAIVEGIQRETVSQVSQIAEKVKSGTLPTATISDSTTEPTPQITLGSELARKLQIGIGDSVVLTIPFAKGGDTPLLQKLKVVGILKLGMHDYDSKYGLMDIADLQKIMGQPGKVNAFKILTDNASTSYVITNLLNDKYVYPLRSRDWSSLNRNLFYAIKLEKAVISIILMAIVLVASFNIISTIMMLVHDKKRQISMLKAMGWSARQTFTLFLLIGSSLSVLGALLGLGIGRALCALVAWKSIIDLPADIYLLSRIPIEIRWQEWALICVITVGLALFSTLWPSYRISRENPVEGLRYE